MLQVNRLGNRLGKDWVMSAIEDRLSQIQQETMTTVTYYAVTVPTPHPVDTLRLDSGRTRKQTTRKSKTIPRSTTSDFVLL